MFFGSFQVARFTSLNIPYLTPAPIGLNGLTTEDLGNNFLYGCVPLALVYSVPVTDILSTIEFMLCSMVAPTLVFIVVFCSIIVLTDGAIIIILLPTR